MTVIVRGKYRTVYGNLPVTLEWQLPIEEVNPEVFRKIGEEMRKIAFIIRKQEERELRRRLNVHRQNLALQNLRWLFWLAQTTK